MNKEIKEILEGIEVVIKHDGTLEFDAKELKILLNYATKLQSNWNSLREWLEENESFDDYCNETTFTSVLDKMNELEGVEEEKKIPRKLGHLIGYDIQQFDDLKEYVEITTNDLFGKLNKVIDTLNYVIDYLKSKGE